MSLSKENSFRDYEFDLMTKLSLSFYFLSKLGKILLPIANRKIHQEILKRKNYHFEIPQVLIYPLFPKKKFIEISSPFLLHHFGFSKLRKVFFFPLKNSIYFFQPIRDRSNISLTKIRGLLFYFSSFLEQK